MNIEENTNDAPRKSVNLHICGGNRTLVEFDQVQAVPTPLATMRSKPNKKTGELAVSHQPIAHDELIVRTRDSLTEKGFTREAAYKVVQKNAMRAWSKNTSFLSNIISDKKITDKIPVNKLKKLFNFSYHTKKINIIFTRSLKK